MTEIFLPGPPALVGRRYDRIRGLFPPPIVARWMQRGVAPDSKKECASLGQTAAPGQARNDETPADSPKMP
jgi:hypothetical protein